MAHLTLNQVQSLADGSLLAEKEALLRHAAECGRCSKELALQRGLVRAIKEIPPVRTSPEFTRKVMAEILPEGKETWLFRFLGGSGKAIAMAAVLGAVGYALMLLPGSIGESTGESELVKLFSGYYRSMADVLTLESGRVSQTVTNQTSTEGSKIVFMTIASFLALALIDRFLLKPFVKIRR